LNAGVRELEASVIHSFIGMEVHSGMVTRHCERPWVWHIAVHCNPVHLPSWQNLKHVAKYLSYLQNSAHEL
jgi:hypothetical protein